MKIICSAIASLIVISGLALAPRQTAAQNAEPRFKAGDRVEFDYLETSSTEKAMWKKATILEIKIQKFPADRFYVVQLDPLPNQLPKVYTIPVRLGDGPPNYPAPWQTIGWLRRGGGGGAAPKIVSDKLRVDENGTVLADRELLDCDNLAQPKVRNGPAPSTDLAKKLIRCLYEKPSPPGMDGATKLDVTEIVPGNPHRWNRADDIGGGATIDTLVYPFRVKYTQKSFYHTFNQVYSDADSVFTCHVNIDQWDCGLAQRIKDGQKQMIQVK